MSSMDHLDRIGNKVCRVIVHRARNLKPRGKDTKSSPFVTICLGKEKFATSVIEKSQNPEWNEDCELIVRPRDSKLEMTVLHQDFFLERFLGRVEIPLMEIEASPRRTIRGWYKLLGKGSKNKKEDKHRGEIEITAQMKGEETKTILQTTAQVKNIARLDVHPLRKSSSTPFIASTNPFDDNSFDSTQSQRSSTPVDIPAAPPRGVSEPMKSPLSRLQPTSPHREPSPSFQRHGMGRKIVRTSIRKEKLLLDQEPAAIQTCQPHKPESPLVKDAVPAEVKESVPEPLHGSTPNLLDHTEDESPQKRRGSLSSEISNASLTLPGFAARFRKKASTVSSQEKPPEVEKAMKKVENRGDLSPCPVTRTTSEECLSKSSDKLEDETEEPHVTKRIFYKPAAKSARRAKATSQYYADDSPSSPPPPEPASLPSSPVRNGTVLLGEDAPDGANHFATHPYQSLSNEELVKKIMDLEATVRDKDKIIVQQERYIDELLLKVITASPGLLDQGYQPKPSIKARSPVHRYQAKRQEVII